MIKVLVKKYFRFEERIINLTKINQKLEHFAISGKNLKVERTLTSRTYIQSPIPLELVDLRELKLQR